MVRTRLAVYEARVTDVATSPLPPLRAALLIGGASTRMGRPKALLEWGGRSLAEHVHGALASHVSRVVLVGAGAAPGALAGCDRIDDVAGARGPMAGVLAALRFDARAAWLIAACDLPLVRPEAVAWLTGERAASAVAVMPALRAGRVEPLLAIYEPAAEPALTALARRGEFSLAALCGAASVRVPRPPDGLHRCWTNVNTPEELARLCGGSKLDPA